MTLEDLNKPQEKDQSWTLWKEIVGTFIGALPALIAVLSFLGTLYSTVNGHSIEIDHLKRADDRHEQSLQQQRSEMQQQRNEWLQEIREIKDSIGKLQQQVARQEGFDSKHHQ